MLCLLLSCALIMKCILFLFDVASQAWFNCWPEILGLNGGYLYVIYILWLCSRQWMSDTFIIMLCLTSNMSVSVKILNTKDALRVGALNGSPSQYEWMKTVKINLLNSHLFCPFHYNVPCSKSKPVIFFPDK